MGLRHTHKTCVGQAHWHVRILLHEGQNRLLLPAEIEGDEHGLTAKERHKSGSPARLEEMECLREDSFARAPRRHELGRL